MAGIFWIIVLLLPQLSLQFHLYPNIAFHRKIHMCPRSSLEDGSTYSKSDSPTQRYEAQIGHQQRYKCEVAYDGTYFSGWQVQRNAKHRTVAGTLESTLCTYFSLDPANFYVLGSSRTDSGVHARGQVCHFTLPNPCEPEVALPEINKFLPQDLRILNMEPVGMDFHAIASSTAKLYCYRMSISDVPQSPFKRLYRSQVQRGVDLGVLEEAVKAFEGTHDFRAFAGQVEQKQKASGKPVSTVRTVHSVKIIPSPEGNVEILFLLEGALYKMVRNMVGTSVACARGEIGIETLKGMLERGLQRKENRAKPAKPEGLTLEKVWFNEGWVDLL